MKGAKKFSIWMARHYDCVCEPWRLDETNRKVARERLLNAEINCALAKVRAHRAAALIVKARS